MRVFHQLLRSRSSPAVGKDGTPAADLLLDERSSEMDRRRHELPRAYHLPMAAKVQAVAALATHAVEQSRRVGSPADEGSGEERASLPIVLSSGKAVDRMSPEELRSSLNVALSCCGDDARLAGFLFLLLARRHAWGAVVRIPRGRCRALLRARPSPLRVRGAPRRPSGVYVYTWVRLHRCVHASSAEWM